MADVNGDGWPDLLGSGTISFNNGSRFGAGLPATSGGGSFDLSAAGEKADVLGSFKLSSPLRKLVVPYTGVVTITGAIQKKEPGGDGVTVEIHHASGLPFPGFFPPLWQHTIAAGDVSSCTPAPDNACGGGLTLSVKEGDRLYFLASSIEKTDHDALVWAPRVAYSLAAVPGEINPDVSGRQEEREVYGARRFVFDAGEDFRLAGYRRSRWSAPAAGRVRIVPGSISFDPPPGSPVEVTAVVEKRIPGTGTEILPTLWQPLSERTVKAGEARSFDDIDLQVEEGDVLRFRVYSTLGTTPRIPYPIDPAFVHWSPEVTYEGGTYCLSSSLCGAPSCRTEPESGRQVCTLAGDPNGTEIPRGLIAQQVVPWVNVFPPIWSSQDEPLPGGYHGWFYGEWNGNEPFRELSLAINLSKDSTPAYIPAQASPEGLPGVVDAPAWTAAGFDLYLTAEGVKPSRRGRDAASELERVNGTVSSGLDLIRKTTSSTVGIDGGINGGLLGGGFSVSCGASDTQLDLIDLNGDSFPDQVMGGSTLTTSADSLGACAGLTSLVGRPDGAVRLGDGRGGFAGTAGISGLESPVRRTADVSLGLNFGLGINISRKNGKGESKSVDSTLPSVGSALSLSQTTVDLVDVNGDGLPDRVSMAPGEEGKVKVRLNLGYRFGAEEQWDLPGWSDAGAKCRNVANLGTADLAELTSFGTFNALRHASNSVANAGAAFGPIGGGIGTTLSRTLVDLVDVNGDGLPDHVAKDQGDGSFRVKLNQGDHWGQEQEWSDPDWPGGALDDHLSLPVP